MRALALYAVILGLLATFALNATHGVPEPLAPAANDNLALSFGEFRRAAWSFAMANRTRTGFVSISELSLPSVWNNNRDYHFLMEGGMAYVYGRATPEDALKIRARLGNSPLVGYVSDHTLFPLDSPVSSQIPDGALCGILQVTP
jgi:hypothetical protein